MSIYEIIQALRSAQGSKAKQALLDSHADNELLKQFMQATYDPAVSYYQTKLPVIDKGWHGTFEFGKLDLKYLLETLAARRVTGHDAIASLTGAASALNAEGRELMAMVIKRSIGGSVGETMVLKTWPGLFFVPPYMRCAGMSPKVIEEFSDLPYFFVQTKYDGSFGYLEAAADGAKLFTRAGSFYPSWLANKLAECVQNGTVVMGEVLVFRLGKPLSRKESNGILNSLLQGGEPKSEDDFRMIAWDIVSKADFLLGKCDDVYALRLQDAERTFYGNNLTLAKTTVVMNVSEAFALNREAMLRGEEGTVWKKPAGVWRDSSSGTRDAVKVKLVFEAEYKVEGKYEGDGKAKGMLGGFNIATSDGLIKSNVGSGFSDKQRKEFWEADTTDWIITVEANDVISKSGSDTESLFLPIFSERRLDKKVADTRERVLAQLQAAKLGEKLD